MLMKLKARSPFQLSSVIRSHGWSSLHPFSISEEADRLDYVVRLETGRVVDLRVLPRPDGVSVQVKPKPNQAEAKQVRAMMRWMLGMDQDFSQFYALAREEPKLAHVHESAQGRLLRSATLFEDVIKTILTTNTSWAGTKRMVRSLVDQFGHPLPHDPARRAFPVAAVLAGVEVETLRSETRLGYRAPYIRELATKVHDGTLDLESLRSYTGTTAELRKSLLGIKGVGSYAAANILMILGRYDYLPIDSWALKLVSHEWFDGNAVSPDQVETAFEVWGEWRGLAYWNWDWVYLQEAP